MKIDADLPFAFCAKCKVRDLVVNNLYEGSFVAVSFITCEHAKNCKAAVKMYQERIEDGIGDQTDEEERRSDDKE